MVATITPVVKFYITQFSAQKGTVIDVSILSKQAAAIDFTGRATTGAFIKQQPGGSWDIRYGSPSAMMKLARASESKQLPEARYSELSKLV